MWYSRTMAPYIVIKKREIMPPDWQKAELYGTHWWILDLKTLSRQPPDAVIVFLEQYARLIMSNPFSQLNGYNYTNPYISSHTGYNGFTGPPNQQQNQFQGGSLVNGNRQFQSANNPGQFGYLNGNNSDSNNQNSGYNNGYNSHNSSLNSSFGNT